MAKTLRHLRPSILVFSHSLVSCGFQDGVGLVRKKRGHVQLMSTLVIRILPWVAISSGWTFAVPGRTTIFHRYPGYHVPCLIRWIKRTSGMSIYTNNYKHIMTYHDPVVCVGCLELYDHGCLPVRVCVCVACVLRDLHATIYQFVLLQWLFSSAEPWGVILQIENIRGVHIYIYIIIWIWYDIIYIYNNH